MTQFTASDLLLIVEDDDALRTRLEKAMARRGFDTLTAASVTTGLSQIDAHTPAFAIVDLRLPDGSGLDVVEALQQARPKARAVILTGFGNIPTAVAAAKIGAVDYIAKPVTADEIHDALMAPPNELPPPPDAPIPPEEAQWDHIEHVYHQASNNVTHAARLLNMHRRTLQRILRRHNVPTGTP